ncbi:MAG: DUF58 domain-containing protein [Flavobacteriales bacterium]|nr:DUF58 domain-containing protein [Flavobacteriales bacterium]MCX7649876.1 DUF58 domain-containing protein [Flavobacteriales bacterium]MDW8431106.1 DUF58 domain-containing protein [Flavobacteriales bacterium]
MSHPEAFITAEDLVRFGHLELLARKVVEGYITGLHKSPYHGFSVEFAEHRAYNPGDPIRFLDWKVLARTDKLFIKKFEEETNLRCRLVLDISGSMYYPFQGDLAVTKYAFSALAAASLAELLAQQRDAVGLTLVDDQIRYHGPARSSRTHLRQVFTELEKRLNPGSTQALQTTALAQHLHEVAENIPARSMVILFSDLMAGLSQELSLKQALRPLLDALGHLVFRKHEVIVFHVVDASTEFYLQFENRPYEFEDAESGQKIRLNPVEVQREYQALTEEFESLMRVECTQLGIDFHPADIRGGLHQVLHRFMLRRQMMF